MRGNAARWDQARREFLYARLSTLRCDHRLDDFASTVDGWTLARTSEASACPSRRERRQRGRCYVDGSGFDVAAFYFLKLPFYDMLVTFVAVVAFAGGERCTT